jgi:diguanylate cyclase (GGDEF)-like protein
MARTCSPVHRRELARIAPLGEHHHTVAANDPMFEDERPGGSQDDLRQQIVTVLLDRLDIITADTVAIFPYSGTDTLDSDYCQRLGQFFVQVLAFAVRDGKVDPRSGFVADLHRIVLDRRVSIDRLFTFAYLTERTALDELALNETIGATSEPWPLVAQLVRRASFDLLAAYTTRAQLDPSEAAITDTLTTLHTWPLFQAALAKEVERAGRFGYSMSLILFDVDHLSDINKEHGYGVGDKILERLGILMRSYFRQHDWVARHSEDSIVVLLARTDPDNATELAEKVRSTVEERLGFVNHRTDRPVTVTVSAAVVNVAVAIGDVIDPERLMSDVETALERAKRQGRNRVVRVDGYSGTATV